MIGSLNNTWFQKLFVPLGTRCRITECRTLSRAPRQPVPGASFSVRSIAPATRAGAAFHLPVTLSQSKSLASGSELHGRVGNPALLVRSLNLSH